MMTEDQRIEWLLALQEHPEQITGAQSQLIHADDELHRLVQQLGFAKRAFMHDELKNDTPDVEGEWEQFAASHAEELDALTEEKPNPYFSLFSFLFSLHKVAASFIGVLLASGIAFAAIQIVRIVNTPQPLLNTMEQATDIKSFTSQPADTVRTDMISAEAYVFNNVPLDSMITTISVAHGRQVEFENDAARQLRLHFVWKRADCLERVVEKLNTFEAVNIDLEDNKLVVR